MADANSRLFIDGVSGISLVRGVVHVNCVNMRSRNHEAGKAPMSDENVAIENTLKLALTVPGFLQVQAQMAGFLRLLEENGVIRSSEADADDTPDVAQLKE